MQRYSTKRFNVPLTQLHLLSLPWYFLKTEIHIGTLLLIVLRLNLDFTSFPINVLMLFQDPIQDPYGFHHHGACHSQVYDSFSVFSLFFMTLTVLKSADQMFVQCFSVLLCSVFSLIMGLGSPQ